MFRFSVTTSTGVRTSSASRAAYQPRHAVVPIVGAATPMPHRGAVGVTVSAATAAVVATVLSVVLNASASGATLAASHARGAGDAGSANTSLQRTTMADAASLSVANRPAGHRTAGPKTASSPVTSTGHTPDVTTATDLSSTTPLASDGIPVTALKAYRSAAANLAANDPACGIPWPLLAGIGRVESDHGRFGGAQLLANGTSTIKILGPVLDGDGNAVITDTDGGALDGNAQYDRAMGPMQFIPSTWERYASDGNGDGIDDPFNIFDAALAAAKYLCVAGGNLRTTAGQERAVFSYNHLTSYVVEVLSLEHAYAAGAGVVVPDGPVNGVGMGSTGSGSVTGGTTPLAGTGTPATPVRAGGPAYKHRLDRSGAGGGAKPGSGQQGGGTAPPTTTPPTTTPPTTTPPTTTPPTTTPPTTTPPTATPPSCPVGMHPEPTDGSTVVTSGSTSGDAGPASPVDTAAAGTTLANSVADPATSSVATSSVATSSPATSSPATPPTTPPDGTTVPVGCVADAPPTSTSSSSANG